MSMSSTNIEYSVVIPVFNSVASLSEIVTRTTAVLNLNQKLSFEIIFVDDGSSNLKTWVKLQELAAQYNFVRAIRLSRNFGQQSATLCGIRYALGDFIITMDDDLQHPPEEIPKLLLERHHDVVIGQLYQKKHSIKKKLLSKLKGYFDKVILGKPRNLHLSSFRLINRPTANGMLALSNTPHPFLPAMFFFVTRDIVGVQVRHEYRKEGQTGYTFVKMILMFSNLLINNSSLLLSLIGTVGLSISLISFSIGLFLMVNRILFGTSIVGWTSLIVTILVLGGLILFCLGIIGEYLLRIIKGIENRPNYIIRERIGYENSGE